MSIALHGNLRDFGIAEVFQLIGQQRKTGTLVVGAGSDGVCLTFDAGRVVTGGSVEEGAEGGALASQLLRGGHLTRERLDAAVAESRRSARPLADVVVSNGSLGAGELEEVLALLTRETVFDIMRRKRGEFRFTAEPIVHDSPPERLLGAEQILMDGLRMLDEWQTFAAAVPSPDVVFRRVGTLEASRAIAQGRDDRLEQVERVLSLVDGRLPVRRVIDLSRIGTFEATRVLAELRQAGLVEVVSGEARRAPVRLQAEPVSWLPKLRMAVATVVPFVLLAVLAGAVAGPSATGVTAVGAALPDPFGRRITVSHERERIRQLLEVHYFETGAYPQTLAALAAPAGSSETSLTADRLAAYYYRARPDEIVLLAPID